MPAKKPLGLYAGEIEGFHSGDFVAVSQGGTGAVDPAGAQLNLALRPGVEVQAYNSELVALAGVGTTGHVVRTAANTYAARTLQGNAGRVLVSNGSGVAGNPAIDLDTVTDAGGGSFRKFSRDTYGRVSGMSSVVAADLTALVDSIYGRLDGATFTGAVALNGAVSFGSTVALFANAASAMQAVPKQQLDTAITTVSNSIAPAVAAATAAIKPGPTGPSTDRIFEETDQVLTANYTIGQSAMFACTISIATPGVVTQANDYVSEQPVRFETTGALPTGLSSEGVYYVCSAGLSTAAFRVSATVADAIAGTSIATTGTQSGTHTCGKIKDATMTGRVKLKGILKIPTGSIVRLG